MPSCKKISKKIGRKVEECNKSKKIFKVYGTGVLKDRVIFIGSKKRILNIFL